MSNQNLLATNEHGSYKLGVYDFALGVELYRSETRIKDSNYFRFIWGAVYVEDSLSGLPLLQVKLLDGQKDSTGYASHDELRDSIFQTEKFDWPQSAQITYFRGILPGFRDSVLIDSSFMDPTIAVAYTVELVHQSGQVDTIERMVSSDCGQSIASRKVHIANANPVHDTVYLRVRGELANLPDGDTNVEFALEVAMEPYQSFGDTTIVNSSHSFAPQHDSCLLAAGPYPNPTSVANPASILATYCEPGQDIAVSVFDALSNPVGITVHASSTGEWQRIYPSMPVSSGSYHVIIGCAGRQVSLNWSTIN